ncbi:unnamed protein product [Effrenium voratum]|uniref:Uncharacterized protein n=1 Tax=Effrenium voratum TaxID=2562239 RepID=A0AA36HMV7_9DINO|nr:unnamed protein product [Effrenium voratum]
MSAMEARRQMAERRAKAQAEVEEEKQRREQERREKERKKKRKQKYLEEERLATAVKEMEEAKRLTWEQKVEREWFALEFAPAELQASLCIQRGRFGAWNADAQQRLHKWLLTAQRRAGQGDAAQLCLEDKKRQVSECQFFILVVWVFLVLEKTLELETVVANLEKENSMLKAQARALKAKKQCTKP